LREYDFKDVQEDPSNGQVIQYLNEPEQAILIIII